MLTVLAPVTAASSVTADVNFTCLCNNTNATMTDDNAFLKQLHQLIPLDDRLMNTYLVLLLLLAIVLMSCVYDFEFA